jgi:hypothetical protein
MQCAVQGENDFKKGVTVHFHYTKAIQKVSTICTYLSRILETVTLRMCSDFLN